MEKQGRIQVYTGDGKGKTTAALGLTLRALGHGSRVVMIQFMKGMEDSGEVLMAKKLAPLFTLLPMGRAVFVDPSHPDPLDLEMAHKALDTAKSFLKEGACDILILDEINVALAFGLLLIEEVMELIDGKPPAMELILTGRYAHPEVMARADLVTEMKNIKHYFDQGMEDRECIER
jgi:cob(I)alamin adenosyltransferase